MTWGVWQDKLARWMMNSNRKFESSYKYQKLHDKVWGQVEGSKSSILQIHIYEILCQCKCYIKN